jgi:hypothetical protein
LIKYAREYVSMQEILLQLNVNSDKLLVVKRKPQQHTLSVRISEALRDYLERAREVISTPKGESPSTSDVAKMLLEMARGERLEDRLEVTELLRHPTETLLAVRQKWEQERPLSRAEWIVLAHYLQVGCEGNYEDQELARKESFADLLEAFLAILKVRPKGGREHHQYYLGNLGASESNPDSETLTERVQESIQALRGSGPATRPLFAGRNLYVALRDEDLEDVAAVNRALAPYLRTLYGFAARGHWLQEHRPLRTRREVKDYGFRSSVFPKVEAGDFRLTILLTDEEDLAMALEMPSRDVVYPLEPFPLIREFATLLTRLESVAPWKGREFFGYAGGEVKRYYFRHRSNGITFGFSREEWQWLKQMFSKVLGLAELQPVLSELALQYGDV